MFFQRFISAYFYADLDKVSDIFTKKHPHCLQSTQLKNNELTN